MELVRLSSQEEQQIAASNVFCLITQDDKINIREANSTEPCSALECVLSPMWAILERRGETMPQGVRRRVSIKETLIWSKTVIQHRDSDAMCPW